MNGVLTLFEFHFGFFDLRTDRLLIIVCLAVPVLFSPSLEHFCFVISLILGNRVLSVLLVRVFAHTISLGTYVSLIFLFIF